MSTEEASILPPPEEAGDGPWHPSILLRAIGGPPDPGKSHWSCCLRCALRMAGVRRPAAFQASLSALHAALAAMGINLGPDQHNDPSACCAVCLGILQGEEGAGHAAVAEIAAVVKARGYELLVEGAERPLGFALGLSLPYCEAIRTRACWEWLASSSTDFEPSSSDGPLQPPIEVKEIVRQAVEDGIVRHLGFRPDATAGEMRLSLAFLHPAADHADYEGAVKALLPAARGRAFNRTKKRKRSQGSNSDNLCSQPVVAQLLAAVGRSAEVKAGLVHWFLSAAALGPGVASRSVSVAREPLFLYGRYQKFSRELPQTAWVVDGGQRMGKGSVEEIVADPIKEWCRSEAAVFMGSGREDMDVRMLGSGRPFLLQVNDPKRVPRLPEEVAALEAAINAPVGLNAAGDVKVTRLRLSDRAMVKRMHGGAEAKEKLYTCLVWAGRALTEAELLAKLGSLQGLQVQQKTPVRVLHRRSLMTRPKVIHELRCDSLRHEPAGSADDKLGASSSSSYFRLHLRTSAGTYVKEFVHGDLGRTRPNVGELLDCKADILELDVTDVLLADPDG